MDGEEEVVERRARGTDGEEAEVVGGGGGPLGGLGRVSERLTASPSGRCVTEDPMLVAPRVVLVCCVLPWSFPARVSCPSLRFCNQFWVCGYCVCGFGCVWFWGFGCVVFVCVVLGVCGFGFCVCGFGCV